MMVHLASRLARLEREHDPRRPLTIEEAIAVLDAHPQPPGDAPDFTDAELDAEWDRLRAEWAKWEAAQ